MTTPPAPTPGRAASRADGERSRERILDAAERLFTERGFSGTGIAAISRESGLPASSIYWFFSSKQDLAAAVVERAADRFISALNEGATDTSLRGFLVRALEQSGARLPGFARLQVLLALERGEQDPAIVDRLRRVRNRARRLVADHLGESMRALGEEAGTAVVDPVSFLALALAEGALIAHHVDPAGIDLDDLAGDLEVAILAIAERRLAGSRS